MKIYIVDAFTSVMYRGNPAAVCLLDSLKSDDWMRSVANEMHLSETAFLYPNNDNYLLRWFTPITEVDLCGHATLASAHILWEENICSSDIITFKTKSGKITAERMNNRINMNFPVEICRHSSAPPELMDGLNIPFRYVGRNRLDYLVEVENEETVMQLRPDFNILKQVDTRGVIVTSRSDHVGYDFVSRCFYPALGVNEDPVTGSAHCCLGPYWGNQLHKNRLRAIQLSERQGELDLELTGERIIISGQAITTMRGELVRES